MLVPLSRNAQIARFISAATSTLEPSVQKRFVNVLSMASTEELEAIEKFALRLAEESKKEQGSR